MAMLLSEAAPFSAAVRAALRGRIALLGIEGLLAGREVKRLLALETDEHLVLILQHGTSLKMIARTTPKGTQQIS